MLLKKKWEEYVTVKWKCAKSSPEMKQWTEFIKLLYEDTKNVQMTLYSNSLHIQLICT